MKTVNPKLFRLQIILALLSCILFSCTQKQTVENKIENIPAVAVKKIAEKTTVTNNIDSVIFNIVLGYYNNQSCCKKTIDGAENIYPQTVTVEFNNCAKEDGISKSGKLIIFYTHPMNEPGSIASAYFDNFYIGDTLVKGSMFTTNISKIPGKENVFEHSGTQSFVFQNRAFKKYKIDRVFTQIAGISTAEKTDDKFSVTGSIKIYDNKDPVATTAEVLSNDNEINNSAAYKNTATEPESYSNNREQNIDQNSATKKQHIKLESSRR